MNYVKQLEAAAVLQERRVAVDPKDLVKLVRDFHALEKSLRAILSAPTPPIQTTQEAVARRTARILLSRLRKLHVQNDR